VGQVNDRTQKVEKGEHVWAFKRKSQVMKVKEVIIKIESDGWYSTRQRGSHKIYKHPNKSGIVVVPDHGANKDLAIGTEINILKQAGLK
jgi:predicted RNA binding protein YcfA (HicA-like mRNA interferase family)